MAHQSGIRADDTVVASLKSQDPDVRAFKLKIINESVVLTDTVPASSDWETDYNKSILPLLDKSSPCYVFYRLDSTTNSKFDWIFIPWTPECSDFREKTIYASTRATIRKQFGDNRIKEDISATEFDEVDLQGFKEHLLSKTAPAPLTALEREKAALLNDKTFSGFHTPHQTVKSVYFSLTDEAALYVRKLSAGSINYLQLSIDLEQEVILFSDSADKLPPEQMASRTPKNEGRYHLYRFDHHHNGAICSVLFFIHSISGYQSSVKSRMLYSSCKASLISMLEDDYRLPIIQRLEVDDMKEVTAEYLLDTLYPKPTIQQLKFEKPQGPAGRRPRTKMM